LGDTNGGNFIAWDAAAGKIVWSKQEKFPVWSGALTTAGNVIFYGTLEGYIKALDLDGKELWRFKTGSGVVGNVFTYQYAGKQYVGVLSGIDESWPLGTEAFKSLSEYSQPGGVLTVFALPN